MQTLRGTGNTFSTSGKAWRPFRFNPKVASHNARLNRLKAKGLLPATDKASQREAAAKAALAQPIRRIP